MTSQVSIQPNSTRQQTRFLPARKNPLAVNRTAQIPFRFAHNDWAFHLETLRELTYRAAVVGPQGSGKSTLLAELHQRLQQRSIKSHFVFLPQPRKLHQPMLNDAMMQSEQGCVLLVDGIERLNFFQRRELFKQTKNKPGLVITKHHACRLPTWIQTGTTPELMTEVLTDLNLAYPEILTAGQVAFKKHNGNIRNALRDLYDQCAAGGFNEILSR